MMPYIDAICGRSPEKDDVHVHVPTIKKIFSHTQIVSILCVNGTKTTGPHIELINNQLPFNTLDTYTCIHFVWTPICLNLHLPVHFWSQFADNNWYM